MSPKQNVTINPSKGGFAIYANGEIVRDGFTSRGHAAMWATRQGLYQSTRTHKRNVRLPIPDALVGERIFGLPFYAHLQNRSYHSFLAEARAGKWGPLLKISKRYFGIRFGDYQKSVAAREIKPTA
jgi:hypothetical protein